MPVGHLYAFFVFLTSVCADGLIFGQFQLVITLGCVSHLGDGRSLIMVMARVQEIVNVMPLDAWNCNTKTSSHTSLAKTSHMTKR